MQHRQPVPPFIGCSWGLQGSRLEAQSKGLVERAAAAAAAALQEEGGGEEGPGAAAARRAAQAGASSTSDGLGSLGGVQNHISTLRSVIKLPAVVICSAPLCPLLPTFDGF